MNTILILSLPRTGSSNLQRSLCSAYNFKLYFESDKVQPELYTKGKQIRPNSVHKLIIFPSKGIDYYLDLIERFDFTILLSRRDLKQTAESFYILKNINNGKVNAQWNDMVIDREGIRNLEEYKRLLKNIKSKWKLLQEISEKTNIPIDFYEDVYSQKRLLNQNIKLDLEYMSERRRCRQSGKQSLL